MFLSLSQFWSSIWEYMVSIEQITLSMACDIRLPIFPLEQVTVEYIY